MKVLIKKYFDSFVHIIFPHNCANCDSDTLHQDSFLCSKCFTLLPATGFFDVANNPVEKIFYGRVKIESAASGFYFNKHSIMQNLISQLKYRGNKEAGIFLGKQIGKYLNDSERFNTVDVIVPVPLNTQKEKKRGYNQSLIIAEGLVQEFKRPILNNLILRSSNTESQTKKSRSARFQNMQNVFEINKNSLFDFKHILIIDDVITTGATLESCCTVLHSLDGIKISIASVAIAQ